MKLFIVDTISTFRLRYVIEAESLEHAYDEVTMNDSSAEKDIFEAVSQKHLGEIIIDGQEINKKKFDKMLEDLENNKEETCSYWMGEKLIHKIDYSK
jgi:hypothetical protein